MKLVYICNGCKKIYKHNVIWCHEYMDDGKRCGGRVLPRYEELL